MFTSYAAKFFIWLHFRLFRYKMWGQRREDVKKDYLEKCEVIFDSAWPEDFPIRFS